MTLKINDREKEILKSYSLRVYELLGLASGLYATYYEQLKAILPPKVFAGVVVSMAVVGWLVRFLPQAPKLIDFITGDLDVDEAIHDLQEAVAPASVDVTITKTQPAEPDEVTITAPIPNTGESSR